MAGNKGKAKILRQIIPKLIYMKAKLKSYGFEYEKAKQK